MPSTRVPFASQQCGDYPRPQLLRQHWTDLCGEWEVEFDDGEGEPEWSGATISVPFPPESTASGIGDPLRGEVIWYRRAVTSSDIETAGYAQGMRLVLHFGAVDFRSRVWINGDLVGEHEGGHTPFSFDVTEWASGDFRIVVRTEDLPQDLEQPRGKQDWQENPHVIWYPRTSGIWQPVWLEAVPNQHLTHLRWRSDIANARVELDYELAAVPCRDSHIRVALSLNGMPLGTVDAELDRVRGTVGLLLPALHNGQDLDAILWSPDHPHLVDAQITISDGSEYDAVASYFGLRSVSARSGAFCLNGWPYFIRAVLSQGFWPQSHLAAPSSDALRAEIQLIKDLGFNTARVHQKIEDPRMLYWADRLGVMIWEEMPSALEFSEIMLGRLTREWLEVIRRDGSHPSIVVWVPFNESWGVHQISVEPRHRDAVEAIATLTKALDPSRLVISNDGWEHMTSDLLTIHDYRDPSALRSDYALSLIHI